MNRTVRLAALITLIWSTTTPAATAAEPAAATADASGAHARWTGTIEGPESVARDVQVSMEGGSGGTCERPTCDSFSLTVSGAGGRVPLKLSAAADPDRSNNIDVEIVLPDGSTVFDGPPPFSLTELSTGREITIPNAVDGAYVVRIFGEPRRDAGYVMTYMARAHLDVPPAPAASPAPAAPAAHEDEHDCNRAKAAVRRASASLRRARRAGDRRAVRRHRSALGRARARAGRTCAGG